MTDQHRQPSPGSWPPAQSPGRTPATDFNWQKHATQGQPPSQEHAQTSESARNHQQGYNWVPTPQSAPTQAPGWPPSNPAQPTFPPPSANRTSHQYGQQAPPGPVGGPGPEPTRDGAAGFQSATARASIRDRAIAGDQEALQTLFGQFIPPGEQIVEAGYMGVLGIWGIGTHSFAAITPNRSASLQMSTLGGVLYQDAPLEYVNSAAVFQPSKVSLYINVATTVFIFVFLAAAMGFGVSPVLGIFCLILLPLALPLSVRLHYRLHKSGLVLWVREGLSINIFIDRPRMKQANRYYRTFCDLREERIKITGASI